MDASTRLWMIRHGEVAAPHVGAFVGTLDVGLSDVGRHQAQAVAAYLEDAELDVLLTSPRERARHTARPLAHATGLSATIEDGLAEMHFGAWEGMKWPEIEAAHPDEAARWQTDPGEIPCGGGDTANGFATRVHATLDSILDRYQGRSVAMVAHAGTNRAVLSWLLGRPYLEMFSFAQDYGCVNAGVKSPDGTGQIALLNFVPGPRSAVQGDGGRKVPEAEEIA